MNIIAKGILIAAATAALAGCRKTDESPSVAGARVVIRAEDVRLFLETPVSTREFESTARSWTERVWPRFNEGRIHSYPPEQPGGEPRIAEVPPRMAFRNRGNDCGPAADRRVCALPWEDVRITVCGRPLDGHLGMSGGKLTDTVVMVCRLLTPEQVVDGEVRNSERDCSKAPVIPISKFRPEDLRFLVGDVAIVAGTAESHDPAICSRLPQADAGSSP